MGYRTLDSVLTYDVLTPGKDPTYDLSYHLEGADVWYLGMAGELASEIKCSKITLPMLSKEEYDWKKELLSALKKAVSYRPQTHVDSFKSAYDHFSKEMSMCVDENDYAQFPGVWFGNADTVKVLKSYVEYEPNGKYKGIHYDVDRCGLVLDLPPRVIAIVPPPEYFGVLAVNEKYFNFLFHQKRICVYHLKDLKID